MADDFTQFSFEIDRGATEFLDFQITLNALPQNVTGWTIWFTAKYRVADADPGVFQKSTLNGGIVITTALTGIGYVRIDPADTNGLPIQRLSLYADQKAKDGGGQLFITQKGRVIVRPTATLAF